MNLTRITRIMESRWFFVLTVLLFRLSLDAAYVAFGSPWFGYEGFGLNLSSAKYLESWALLVVVACYTPYKLKRPSDYLLVTFFLTVLVPILAFYGLNDQSRVHLYIVLAGYFTMALSR